MKKIITLILTFTCAVCLSSCDLAKYKKNIWYSDEKIEQCLISNLPKMDGDYYIINDTTIRFNTTWEALKSYANSVFSYLQSENFAYLGTRGHQKASLAGAFASYYFEEIESFEDCYTQMYGKDYIFVYSDGKVDETGHMVFNEIIIADFDDEVIKCEGKDVSCNAKIQLQYDAHYYLEECDGEHIWEEKVYDLASGKYIRCSVCGTMKNTSEDSNGN